MMVVNQADIMAVEEQQSPHPDIFLNMPSLLINTLLIPGSDC